MLVSDTCEELTPECRPTLRVNIQQSVGVLRKTAALFSALGDAERLRILVALAAERRCVGALAEEMGESMSLISQRLKILRNADLVVSEREGRHVYYRVTDENAVRVLISGFEHATGECGE